MKKILFIIEFISLFLIFNVHVSAGYVGDTTGYSNGGISSSGYGNCSAKDCMMGFEGLRISLILTDGEVKAYKNYYFMSNSDPNSQLYRYSWNNGLCNKISYLKGLPGCTNMTASQSGQFQSQSLPSSITSRLGWSNPSKGNTVRNWDVPGLVSKFTSGNSDDPKFMANIEAVYQEVFNGVISLDPTNANYKKAEELNNYWIIIEPLFFVRSKSNGVETDYYGTQYELASLNYKSGIADLIERILPCASVVTGAIAKSGLDVPGINDTSYFDGTLKFVDLSSTASKLGKTLEQLCTNGPGDSLNSEYLTGNYGTGIGLIWVGGITQQKLDKCSDVSFSKSNNKSCKNLYMYGDENYTNDYVEQNKLLYETCFTEYNQKNDTNWTLQKYMNGCPLENKVEKKVDCTPNYNVGMCLNGQSIFYIDEALNLSKEEYWNNCVFNDNGTYKISTHKNSKPNSTGSLSYYDESMGSQYCEVYCIEEMYADFDRSVQNVLAGRYFSWNNHSITGSRTCKTKSIDWAKYEEDIKKANTEIENSYVSWQLEIKKKNNIDNHDTEESSSSCDCIHNVGESCCAAGHRESDSCCTTDKEGNCHGCSWWVCDKPDNTRYDLYTADSTYFSLSTDHGSIRQDWEGTNWCSNQSTPLTNVEGLKTIYETNITYASGLTNNMKSCYTWKEENVYNINPIAEVHYSDGYYSYTGNMETKVKYDMSITNDCKNITSLNYTKCEDNKCYKTDTMNKCSYNNENRNGIAYLTFKTGIYQYISKHDNTAYCNNVDGCNKNINYVDSSKYIYINNIMFPVAYSTSNGIHSTENNNGELSLRYNYLGHIKSNTTEVDNILFNNDNYKKWNCQFSVISKFITSDNSLGINLIYRTIDLKYPFPNMNGNGRITGINWCDGSNCTTENSVVKSVITNNRNVETDGIYYIEPMYTFVLTPSIIREIRGYNNKNNYTNYTGTYEGKNYSYSCKNDTGKNCISDYLTRLIELTDAKDKPGTCTDDKYRNYNDVTNFENCRK